MIHISNKKRKRLTAAINRAERQRKPRRQKHALMQGDPNTPGHARAAEQQVERKPILVKDPSATPASITAELAVMHGVTGNLGRRRDFEHRYFRFHHQHGASLRAKYRP